MVSRGGFQVACRPSRRDCFCESTKFLVRNNNQGAFFEWNKPHPPALNGNEDFNRIIAAGFWSDTRHTNTPRTPFFKKRVASGIVEYVDSEFSNPSLEYLDGIRRKNFQTMVVPISVPNERKIGDSNAYRTAASGTLLLRGNRDNGHHRIAKHVL